MRKLALVVSVVLALGAVVYGSCSSDGHGGDGRQTALSLDDETALPAAGGAAIAIAFGTRFAATTGSVLGVLSSDAGVASSGTSPKAGVPLGICTTGSANVVGQLVPGTTATLTLEDCTGSPLSSTAVNGRVLLEFASVDSWITGTATIAGPEGGGDFTIAPDTVLDGSFAVRANFVPGSSGTNLYLGNQLKSDLITVSETERVLQLGCFEIYTRIGLVSPVIEFFGPRGVLSLDRKVYTLNDYAVEPVPNIGFESADTATPNSGGLGLYSGDNRLDDQGGPAACFGGGLSGDNSVTTARFMAGGVVEADVESAAGECFRCNTTWNSLLDTLSQKSDDCSSVSCGGPDGGTDAGTDGGADAGPDAGTGGSGGTGGTGGADPSLIALSECTGDGLRGFWSFLETLDGLLRYVDDAPDHMVYELPEIVTYLESTHEFAWSIDVDGHGGTETLVSGELQESSGTLSHGIENGEVIHALWSWTVEAATTGAGKLAIVGLGPDTVQVTPVEEPWYHNGVVCHLQVTNIYYHLDLATPGSERTAFVSLGFWAEAGPYMLTNAWATFGETTVGVDGQYNGQPFSFDLDADTYELVQ